MKQFWAKTQSSYIFEVKTLTPNDNLNFLLFVKINKQIDRV